MRCGDSTLCARPGFQGFSVQEDKLSELRTALTELPFVSMIVHCRNEERFIGACLDTLMTNGYPLDRFEVLVVDGMSEDGTRESVLEYATRYPMIRLVDNPKRITPAAVNTGVAASTGNIIFILGSHAYYEPGYFECCVRALEEFEADCVGGVMITKTREQGPFANAIKLALTLPLGVGNSRFRTGVTEPKWVDATVFGCIRKELFERVGPYNEALVHSHDMDFWNRVRRSGGRLLVHPKARSVYLARSTLSSFWKHNVRNGFWVTWPMRLVGTRFSWRHLVPLWFLSGMVVLGIGGLVWRPLWWIGAAAVSAYVMATVVVSLQAGVQQRDWRLLFTGPVAFSALHLAYGLGSLWGLVKPITGAKRKAAREAEKASTLTKGINL